jgi:pantoate--beta-alanine ligase
MRVLTTIEELRHQRDIAVERGERVGLVPTRGDLHDGHAALLRVAHAQCDVVVCSIVRADGTPAVHERDDERIAAAAGADIVWRPRVPGPIDRTARLRIVPRDRPDLADVATSDAHLLNLLRPSVVYVGDAHFDHARILSDIARELMTGHVEVRVVASPRDPAGLALGAATSSLDQDGREAAGAVPRALTAVVDSVAAGEHSLFRLRARAEAYLADAGVLLDVEDVATVDPHSHDPVDVFDRDVLMVVRARVGDVAIVDSRLLAR